MTLSRKIADAVDFAPFEAPPGTCPAPSRPRPGPSRLALNLTARRPRRARLRRAGLRPIPTGATCPTEALRGWGDRLAARLTYLMEPLVVLEVDAQAGEAELRSQAPTPRGDRRSFYEVRLRREGSLHLRRVAFDRAGPTVARPSPAR